MIRILGSLLVVTALSTLAGCSEETSTPSQPVNAPPNTPTEDAGASAGRRLVDKSAFATSPTNLITDPNFALGSSQVGYTSFLAFYESGSSQYEITTSTDSRSPAGFGGSVAKFAASGATDTKAKSIVALTSILGGNGPFDAQLWVSKSNVDGTPADITTGNQAFTASVTAESLDGKAYDLEPEEGSNLVVGARTWVKFHVTIADALPHGGFFLIRTGTGGGNYLVASPEVVAQPLVGAMGTRSLSLTKAKTSRALSAVERSAIARYKAIPPRLVPAAPNAPRGI